MGLAELTRRSGLARTLHVRAGLEPDEVGFGKAVQRQHDLYRRQVRLLKDRAAVEVIGRSTHGTAIRRLVTTARAAKQPFNA